MRCLNMVNNVDVANNLKDVSSYVLGHNHFQDLPGTTTSCGCWLA